MALYNTGSGGWKDRAQNQANGAMRAMGGMTRENQTTEIKPGSPPATQVLAQGVGLTGTANQLWNLKDKVRAGYDWLEEKLNTPDVQSQARAANAGAQTAHNFAEPAAGGAQMNSGPQVTATAPDMPDFINGAGTARPLAGMGAVNAPEARLANMGEQAAQSLQRQMYAAPEALGGSPELAREASQTASRINATGPESLTGGLTASGIAGSSLGGFAGGFAGKELGRAIGGDTGAAIGGAAGSLGGAYLGGLAASSLAGGAGAAGGAVAGAAAGSAVPGLGTIVGAGIGALGSLFM